jgi:hypothetical protein
LLGYVKYEREEWKVVIGSLRLMAGVGNVVDTISWFKRFHRNLGPPDFSPAYILFVRV